jgi:hypothetical protein
MRCIYICLLAVLFSIVMIENSAAAAGKAHVITFGKWTSVQWFPGDRDTGLPLKIRALNVDGRVKEYVLGMPHEVTDRLFVVQRVFRVNDSLPEDSTPHWQWQRGGWLLVDRTTGHVSPINLPEFDAFYSAGNWYRDYIAYCGVSDDGQKIYAVVAQLGRRKPVLKKPLSSEVLAEDAGPDSACPAPMWQRSPMRVSFESEHIARQTFSIKGHVVDVVNDAEEEDEGSK